MRALAQRVIVSLLPLLAQPTAAWRPLLTRRQLSVAILSAVPLPAAANGLGDELGDAACEDEEECVLPDMD